MNPELGISVVLLRPIAQGIHRLGGDPAGFLAALGVDERTDVDAYVPGRRIVAALAQLPARASVGLALAQVSPIGSLGFLDYLFVTSTNLREALTRCVRFYGLATQIVTLQIKDTRDRFTVYHTLNAGAPRVVALTEFAFAALVSRARDAVGDRFRVHSVSFTHAVSDPRTFDTYFGVKVAFGGPVDELVFNAEAADVPFATSDPTTAAFLEAQASRMQAKLVTVDSFTGRARTAIALGLRNKKFDVASIARDLHTSTRNLQRLLKQHGTSHRELVADVQRELAMELLARPEMSVIEVAYELGFTQHAAFHRAFARWTGTTPGAYRKSVVIGSARP